VGILRDAAKNASPPRDDWQEPGRSALPETMVDEVNDRLGTNQGDVGGIPGDEQCF